MLICIRSIILKRIIISCLSFVCANAFTLSTHVLDSVHGIPASGIEVELFCDRGGWDNADSRITTKSWEMVDSKITIENGRIDSFKTENLVCDALKLRFNTSTYYKESFYPYIDVIFRIDKSNTHYHVPIILSPFGYSTYRGS